MNDKVRRGMYLLLAAASFEASALIKPPPCTVEGAKPAAVIKRERPAFFDTTKCQVSNGRTVCFQADGGFSDFRANR